MFQHITLFSKRNNIISAPGPHWTPEIRIYCTCDLDIGFGSILRWTHHNPIKLTAMISFYKQLSRPRYGIDETPYSFAFDSSITVKWRDTPGYNTHVQVYAWSNTLGGRKEELLIEKVISYGIIHNYGVTFFNTVMRALTMANADEMSVFFAELINRGKNLPPAEFKIGQRVSTIIGPNVKTLRTGYVISYFYHYKDNTNMYFLMVDGEVQNKRYLPGDLRPV
jgi:hypothetical protein